MRATIKSLHLENFKGVKNATCQFNRKNVSVIGQNGAGKTTLFTAYMWLVADKDSDLKSNPNIRPLGTEECTPRVEVIFDIDRKEVTAAKIQKCTVKKSKTGGADTISLSNSYEVNSVEYGERDFKKKMTELGFDFDLFLPLSHPDVFTSQKSADMRKALFGMASEKSDYEIACDTERLKKEYAELDEETKNKWTFEEYFDYEVSRSETGDAALLLKNYTAEEVKAMQNATLRKIREEYGKDGEILRAKIEGMEQSKTDIDVAELELLKNALNEQIAENKARQEDISKEFEEQKRASDGILELKFELNDLQRKANEELVKQKRDLQSQIDEKNEYLLNISNGIQRNNREIYGYEQDIENGEKERKRLLEQWNVVNAEVFDENTAICPTCHRELPSDERERLLSTFEKSKAERLAEINKKGLEVKADIENAQTMIPKLQECNKDNLANKEKLEKEVADLEQQLSELPESIDISDRPEVQEIQRQIAEKEKAMNKGNSAEEIRQKLKSEGEDLQSQLTEVEKQLALAQKNVEIDEQITDLRKKQGEYEQNRANAEKILYQLDLVSRKKNELLTEDINKNFDIVKWQMFEYQKNGDYKDCCVPMIDGKRFGESTNTGREVLAKLDIIKGLQRFYGQNYPVFLDGAECLSDETVKRIEMDCQLVLLKVSEDKELKIEMEG